MKSIIKRILISFFCLFSLLFFSCEIGLGEAVDIDAPVVEITAPEPTSSVPSRFTVSGSVSDNIGVTELTISVSETGQTYMWDGSWHELKNENWVNYSDASFSGDSEKLYFTLNLTISGASSGETFTLCTSATDECNNEGKQSKDERSITVDVNAPSVSIITPAITAKFDDSQAELEEFKNSQNEYDYKDGALLKKLINKSFTISGTQKEDTKLNKLYVMLDESSEAEIKPYSEVSDISSLPHLFLKEVEGARSWSCEVTEADIPANCKTGPHLIRLVTESHDAAGNVERRVQGWFIYWNESDIPWVKATFGDDNYIQSDPNDPSAPKQTVVYPSCTLQGEAYDDDGLKAIDIEVWISENADTEPSILRSDFGKHIDLTAKEYPTFYAWSVTAITEKKNFKVIVKATDKDGMQSETITRYLGISNVNPPSITIDTPSLLLGDKNGKFTITGSIKDDGPLESTSLTIVRISNGKESTMIDYYTPTYEGWTSVTNGNTPYTVSLTTLNGGQPDGGYYKYTFSKTFDLFSDFKIGNGQNIKSQTFMFKVIDGQSSDDESKRSSTVQSITLQGDNEAPKLTIDKVTVKHSNGTKKDYLFNSNSQPTLEPFVSGDTIQYSGTWSDNTTSYWNGGKSHINTIDLSNSSGTITSSMDIDSSGKGSWNSNWITPPNSATESLTASLTDWGGNTTTSKISYYVSSSNPRLERITADNADGYYQSSSEITIVLEYNKKVTFTGNGATLILNNKAEATYDTASNSNGSSKHYYKVTNTSSETETSDLNVETIKSNNCTWTDADGTPILNPSARPIINLETSRTIVIDKTAPKVKKVSVIPSSGNYTIGKELIFNVDFDSEVKFGNTDNWSTTQLNLKFSDTKTKSITPSARTSSTSLQFKYTIASGDDTNNLSAIFDANSCTIKDYAGNSLTPQASATAFSNLHIDTVAPKAPVISGISEGDVIYSSEGTTFSVTRATGETGGTLYYSLDDGKTTLVYPKTGNIKLSTNGEYKVKAYHVDAAGNKSLWSSEVDSDGNVLTTPAPINVKVDIGNILTSITSSTADGTYKEGKDIYITLNFRKEIKVSGSYLKLNITNSSGTNLNRTATPEPSATAAKSVTYKYSIVDGDFCNKLVVNSFEFSSITDKNDIDIKNYVALPDETSNNRLEDNRIIKILTGAPEILKDDISISANYLDIPFSSLITKGTGKITIVMTDEYKPPVIMTPSEWSSYNSTIKNFYEQGTNGSDSTGNSDLTEKYILKYDTTDAQLQTLITALKTPKKTGDSVGADGVEIPIDSTAVEITGTNKNIVRINISNNSAYKLPVKGATYKVLIPANLVQNELGTKNKASPTTGNGVITVKAPGVETPVIRINKKNETINGTTITQPLQAEVKIDCQSPLSSDMSISYTIESTPYATKNLSRTNLPENTTNYRVIAHSTAGTKTTNTRTYSTPFNVGGTDTTNGYKVLITAKVMKNGTALSTSYEYAQRTVVIFEDTANANGLNYRWIRGGDRPSGGVSTPGFPFTWTTTDYDKVRAMSQNNAGNWYWVSWNVNTTAYIGFLAGNMPANASTMGPQEWCWASCAWVGLKEYYPAYAGESITFPSEAMSYSIIGGINRGNYGYQDKHRESR